jgi:DNA primase
MEISEIKRRLSIETVLQHYNLTPDRNRQICCPFHEDDTPSCRIYPQTNSFHCFGCGATGDQIEFIERYEKCSKHEALTQAAALITNYELRIKRNGVPVGTSLKSQISQPRTI